MLFPWRTPAALALALTLCACEGETPNSGSDTDASATEATGTGADAATDTEGASAGATTDESGGSEATSAGEPFCGDGLRQEDEACDGADFGEHTCASQGFIDGGELTCSDACTVDVSRCAGCEDWYSQLGGKGGDAGRSIHLDAAGNLYVAGETTSFIDGYWTHGDQDVFVTKYTADGTKAWTSGIGTVERETVSAVTSDGAGAIYVAGTTKGAFDGYEIQGITHDAFLTKLDADGAILWTYQYGTVAGESPKGVAVDSHGNVFLTGSTGGDLDGNVSAGGSDVFLTKFDADGTKLWTKLYGTTEHENNGPGHGQIAIDADDNIILAGTTDGALGEVWSGGIDSFVAKLDGEGTILWLSQFGGPESESISDLALADNGDIFVTGFTGGSLNGQAALGGGDAFVSKFTTDGNIVWTRLYGTPAIDSARGIALTGDGGFWLVGSTRGEYGDNPIIGLIDVFIARYDGNGGLVWSTLLGTAGIDSVGNAVSDPSGALYTTGAVYGGLFGAEHQGYEDMFVLRVCGE